MKPKFREFFCNSSIEGFIYAKIDDGIPFFEYMTDHPSSSWIELVMNDEIDGINSRMLQL
jgi:hypothetical protein